MNYHRADWLERRQGRVARALLIVALACGIAGFAPASGLAQLQQPVRAATVANAQDDQWDDRFGSPGVTCCAGYDKPFAVEVVGGDVYVGGEFSSMGDREGTRGIARWDGRSWHALGTGMLRDGDQTGNVYDVAVSGDNVYVVGNFDHAGGVSANGVARWSISAQTWSAVGSGVGPADDTGDAAAASSVAVVGNEVYIGGNFAQVNGVATYRVAVWNGTAWAALAGGVADNDTLGFDHVNAIVGAGDLVYVGGKFENAINPDGIDDVVANNIAVWNRGSKRWSALGAGVSDVVRALAIDGSNLYVGGDFTKASGQAVGGIARWNGAQWSGLGAGSDGAIYSLVVANGSVYAAGAFSTITGVANTNSLAAWDGSQWRSLRSESTVQRSSRGLHQRGRRATKWQSVRRRRFQ